MIDDLRGLARQVKRSGKMRLKGLITSSSRTIKTPVAALPTVLAPPVAEDPLLRLTRRIELLERQLSRETDRSREREAAAVLADRTTMKTIVTMIERRSWGLADRFVVLQRELDAIRTLSSELCRDVTREKVRATRSSEAVQTAARTVAEIRGALEQTTAEVRLTLESIVLRLDGLTEAVQTSDYRLNDLARAVERVDAELAVFVKRHRATPYMTQPVFPSIVQRVENEVFDDVGFAEIFRGSPAFISDRQRAYDIFLREGQRIIDLGCGRGEFLELARKVGAVAVGVDRSAAMASLCVERGLEVRNTDALEYLKDQPVASADLIFSAQFIEHIAPDDLYALFVAARRVLSPGGMLIAETVNPHCVEALKCFYVDLSHVKPIFPEVALFFARSAGFTDGRIFYPTGDGFDERAPWDRGEYALVATV